MQNSNLIFIESWTLDEFYSKFNSTKVEAIKGASGKLFFRFSPTRTGTVSSKGAPVRPIISLVHETKETEPTPQELEYVGKSVLENGKRVSHPKAGGYFLLLHEEANGGNVIQTWTALE